MSNSRVLGLVLPAPALVFVVLFFLAPVVLTGVFAMTNMSTATGITGGSYQITRSSMQVLRDRHGELEIADALSKVVYTVDEDGLAALAGSDVDGALISELRDKHLGRSFDSRRGIERAIKGLDNRPGARGSSRRSRLISSARS